MPYSRLGHAASAVPLLLSFGGGEQQSCLWGMRRDPWFCAHADPLEKLASRLQTSCQGGIVFPDEADSPCAPVKHGWERSWWGAHPGTTALLCDTYSSAIHWGWWNTGTGCPEKLWLPPPWNCSRPGWMELWATWSGGRCPCSWQEGWKQGIFKVPSNPNHSVILWFILYLTRWSATHCLHLSWPCSCLRAFHSPSSHVFSKEHQVGQWCCLVVLWSFSGRVLVCCVSLLKTCTEGCSNHRTERTGVERHTYS